MNREAVYEQLKIDEGVVYEVYLDHLGYPTFGVGHLIIEGDAEHGSAVGTTITEERVKECFEKDLDIAVSECEALFGDNWNNYPGELQEVLVNMMFNMGRGRLGGFKKFIAAIEMMDSRWATQVGNRAIRLRDRVANL